MIVGLPLLALIVVRVHQHNERAAWVDAASRAGLNAHLEMTVPGRNARRLLPRWIHDLCAEEMAIVEIDGDADVDRLLSSNAQAVTKVYVRTFIQLTPPQRVSIWARFRRAQIQHWGRGP